MSNEQSTESRLTLIEGGLDSLVKTTDEIQYDLRALQNSMSKKLDVMQQDLHLIVEMFRSQQTQLNKMDTQLVALGHNLELQHKLLEQEIQKREEKEGK